MVDFGHAPYYGEDHFSRDNAEGEARPAMKTNTYWNRYDPSLDQFLDGMWTMEENNLLFDQAQQEWFENRRVENGEIKQEEKRKLELHSVGELTIGPMQGLPWDYLCG